MIYSNVISNTLGYSVGILSGKSTTSIPEYWVNRSHILQMMTLLTMNVVNELNPHGVIHSNPMIEKLIAYINSNYTDGISLDSLTDMFYINKSTLSKEFKDYTSHTIHNYLVMKPISVAKQEMAEGISPSQVYLVSGFKDYSTFYRTFQRTEGMSPKEYKPRMSDNVMFNIRGSLYFLRSLLHCKYISVAIIISKNSA